MHGYRWRKAAFALIATLLLLSVLGFVGEIRAQTNLTITMRDSLTFEPGFFGVTSGESVNLTLINAGAVIHTFTLFAQADANVPVNDVTALLNYYSANPKIVDVSLAGGGEQSIAFTAPLTEGIYTFVCIVPGHAAGGMHGTMQVSSTLPTVAIASPADGSHLASTLATVSGTASDDVGVEKVELSRDGSNYVLATGTTSWSGTLTLIEGPNLIFARATDTSGNTAIVSIAVTVDTTDPGVTITSPSDGASLASTSVEVSGTASDNGAIEAVELSGDGTNFVLATGTTSWSGTLLLVEGPNTISARATDASGNAAMVSITVAVDTVTPTANAGEDQTASVGTAVPFNASSSSDNVAIVAYEWDFGDGTTGTGETTAHAYASPGTYTVTLTVRDAAGNTETDLLIVTVEAPPGFPVSQTVAIVTGVVGAAAAGVAALLLWRRRAGRRVG